MQDFGLIMAGVVLSFLPVVVIYIIFQEQVIKGLTAGAVKG
jgi:raffinose/stachyose/melibiose transport system permease protein